MVNAAFAEANGFVVGDVFHANINGQRRALTITGTALSPEFIYTIGPGALMPDNEGYGILWMTEASVAAAFDMEGAFNHLALRISAEAVPEDVMDALDVLLDPMAGSAPMTGPARSATVSSPPRSTSFRAWRWSCRRSSSPSRRSSWAWSSAGSWRSTGRRSGF
jgi:hypothetical protein